MDAEIMSSLVYDMGSLSFWLWEGLMFGAVIVSLHLKLFILLLGFFFNDSDFAYWGLFIEICKDVIDEFLLKMWGS